MDSRAETLGDSLTIQTIRDFCDQDGWEHRLTDGPWTPENLDAIRSHAVALLDHPRWPTVVLRGLESTDRVEFFQAERAARILGIDPFEKLLDRIDNDPLNGPWHQAWQDVDTQRAQILADRATQLIDLEAIATGPANETDYGPGFEPHRALSWTLEGIRHHPSLAASLVTMALQSPSINNRSRALNALETWGPDHWHDEHYHHLSLLAASDPNHDVRARAAGLLSDADWT